MGKLAFADGETILCFHGPLAYEAKVLKAADWTASTSQDGRVGPHYFVHYKGWKQSWDEWVPEERGMKLTEENRARQKMLFEAQKAKDAAEKVAMKHYTHSNSAQKGKKAEGRGAKRGRDSGVEQEDEYMKKPEIKIVIPEQLKVQLVDDWEAITRNNQLVTLPRKPTVSELLKQYSDHVLLKPPASASKSRNLTLEVVAGLQVYFNKALGHSLLYRAERQQYAELRKRKDMEETPMSEAYGAEHLLRLFVNLPEMIAHTTMDADAVAVLTEHLADLLLWMAAEQKQLFQQPYDDSSPAYQNVNRAM